MGGRLCRLRCDERGFSLPELMIVILIMVIVFGIASPTFFGAIESRRVDSATNQVVGDLRLAQSQATNRLIETTFDVPSANSTTYTIEADGNTDTRTLPGDDQGTPKTKIVVATTIVFKPTGEATTPAGDPAGDITVAALDGEPVHTIEINPITSRLRIVN